MFADDALQLLRDLIAKHHAGLTADKEATGPGLTPNDFNALIEGIAALDEHLSQGGELPSDWKRA